MKAKTMVLTTMLLLSATLAVAGNASARGHGDNEPCEAHATWDPDDVDADFGPGGAEVATGAWMEVETACIGEVFHGSPVEVK